MRKVGRNDPCPCGSGVKYKYCCLHKDQEETDGASASEPASASASRELSPTEEAWETFDAAEYEERKALVEEITGDPERMDAENAFHMLNTLTPTALERGEADWLTRVLDRLEREQPETYAAERPYLLSYHLHAAAVSGHLDEQAAEHVDDLTAMAAQDIDSFFPCIELIAYHGSLAPIAEAMHDGLEAVRTNSDIMPHGKSEFGNEAVQYAILAHYEEHGEVNLQDADLQARIDRIDDPEWGEVDTDYVEQVAARLSGPTDQPWQVDEDPLENLHWLTVDFMRAVFEERDVPLGRVHLAREGLENCYARRHEDVVPAETKRLLQLKQRDVRQQLDEIGSFTSSHPHRRAAFFSLLPAWLEYLERRALLSAATTNTMYHDLRPLRTEVTETLRRFSTDPTLADDVKVAWG